METSSFISSRSAECEFSTSEPEFFAIAPVPTLVRRRRRVMGAMAESSWRLQRKHQVAAPHPHQSRQMRELIAEISLRGNILSFRGEIYRVRPVVAAMLKCLLLRSEKDWQVSDLCQTMYGRAASMRAIRQTVFRMNRALENVNCPVAAYCRGAIVFVRPHVRIFERISDR